MENENDSLKASKVNTIKPLIQRIKNQKSEYDRRFRENEHPLLLADSEIEFMQSKQFSSEDDVKTQEDVQKIIKNMTRASGILSKLNKAKEFCSKYPKYKTESTQTAALRDKSCSDESCRQARHDRRTRVKRHWQKALNASKEIERKRKLSSRKLSLFYRLNNGFPLTKRHGASFMPLGRMA